MKLPGTVALVTGAGKRIGRAVALALAEDGCDVFVHYGRSEEAAERTAADIRGMGRRAETGSADLADPSAIDGLFEAAADRFGRLDILVNSAASFARRPFDEIDAEAWDAVQAVNVRAPFLCTRRAALLMRTVADRPGSLGEAGAPGAVVNFGDLAGVTTWKGYAHHGVSKAGVLHLSRVAARELAPDVRVNAVVPGPILPPPGESADSESWRRKGERVPLARTGDPSHIASTVRFLVENDFVTGATIFVDGGENLLPGGRD
ncbi:MAG: SDR family oxidoreductase [Gemmatimonadota bacterium]|nr:SDR family oxidoreductase [Gemmatimonadota bacterium]